MDFVGCFVALCGLLVAVCSFLWAFVGSFVNLCEFLVFSLSFSGFLLALGMSGQTGLLSQGDKVDYSCMFVLDPWRSSVLKRQRERHS